VQVVEQGIQQAGSKLTNNGARETPEKNSAAVDAGNGPAVSGYSSAQKSFLVCCGVQTPNQFEWSRLVVAQSSIIEQHTRRGTVYRMGVTELAVNLYKRAISVSITSQMRFGAKTTDLEGTSLTNEA
jgi:hypothetical protein